MYFCTGPQPIPRQIQSSAGICLNSKGLSVPEEPWLPWLVGFKTQWALYNICNSSSCTYVRISKQQGNSGSRNIWKSLLFSEILPRISWEDEERSFTFLKYVPADTLGNNVSSIVGILELQAERTQSLFDFHPPLQKLFYKIFFPPRMYCVHYADLSLYLMIFCQKKNDQRHKWTTPSSAVELTHSSVTLIFCEPGAFECKCSVLGGFFGGIFFVCLFVFCSCTCLYTHTKNIFRVTLKWLHISAIRMGGRSGSCTEGNKMLWIRTAVSRKLEKE